jgi:rare lipoprotein A (peptidoglycan hydrolase)/cell division protein FtsN
MKLMELGRSMKLRRLFSILAVISLSACTGMSSFSFRDMFKVENKPVYKIGDPYKIDGVTYYPKEDYQYSEIGLASWYGKDFHGSLTANGEVFDMNALTAAHKTLPMPSFVRVTNLANGKNLVLRVNDRGPFVPGRIIDVSRKAARILGFSEHGLTQVKVEILPEDSLRLKEKMLGITQDTSDMIDNIGGEGKNFKEEQEIGSYQLDNAVEYFPLYEDEEDEKRFSPELEEPEVLDLEDEEDEEDNDEYGHKAKLQDWPDGQAIKAGDRQYVKAYPVQEENYPNTVNVVPVYQAPVQYQAVAPVGYVAPEPVEYIPNPYFTYQNPVVVESAPVLVPQPTAAYNGVNVDVIQDTYADEKSSAVEDEPIASCGSYYVQAASYKKKAYADELKGKLSATINDVFVAKTDVKGTTYYRVRIGPVLDKASANAISGNLHAYGIDKPVVIQNK